MYYYLTAFQKEIKNGNYQIKYGDIPKRPLFLKMVLNEEFKNVKGYKKLTIIDLYKQYVIEKIKRDRTGEIRSLILKRGYKRE